MENKPRVVVEPPDRRGLRQISVGGETVGSAWSLQGLRRTLKHLGYPKDVDVHDRASVCWRGGGSQTWPDRRWPRRITGAILIIGLLCSMVLLVLIGLPDAFGAVTFSQRIAGGMFIAAGALAGVAALAVLDFWGKRESKFSGAAVLLGVLVTLGTTSLLLFLWLEEREYTRYLLAFLPLWFWSAWALRPLLREKAWRGIPHPKQLAAGVAATAVLAAVNLSYSVVYQPSSAPALFELKTHFGTPTQDTSHQMLQIPLTIHMKNIGTVPVYTLGADFKVWGGTAEFSESPEGGLKARKEAVAGDAVTADLYAGPHEWQTISAGQAADPGAPFEPGEEFNYEALIQLPRGAKYDSLWAHLDITFMRKDHGKIDSEFAIPYYSWEGESKECPPEDCGEFVTHRGRLRHNNNLINVTRRPVYVNTVWAVKPDGSYTDTYFSSSPDFISSDPARAARETGMEAERYGVFSGSADAVLPFSALLKSAAR
ncbi:hypothetical protein [Streptomyces sp. R33]|uniref:Uncharacterized protein n=1 Tax=Streptomyces sp. R33 TaxID=3238629 RepID=A0AB39YI43_9ACTN